MKNIIITGGSKGIGEEIVRLLAKKGYNIILNYNNSHINALKIQKELLDNNISIEIFKADVSKREEVKKLIEFAKLKFNNNIDVLINNAGISNIKLFTDITDEDWNNMMNTNLNSVFYCSQEVIKNMINNKKGCIINISSMWGEVGASCEVHYSTSKSAINGFTKSLAKEVGLSNIRVNCIAPGVINTTMNQNFKNEDLKMIKEEIPLGRIGQSIDIAKTVKWLIEDDYTTGQVISVNGGMVIT